MQFCLIIQLIRLNVPIRGWLSITIGLVDWTEAQQWVGNAAVWLGHLEEQGWRRPGDLPPDRF